MSELDIDIARSAGRSTLSLVGELDVGTATILRDAAVNELAEEGCVTLVLDLSRLVFLDSTGLGCWIDVRNRAEQSGAELVLESLTPPLLRTLRMSGLAPLFGLQA